MIPYLLCKVYKSIGYDIRELTEKGLDIVII